MEGFDPIAFLETTVEGAMSTRMEAVPEGEFMAEIRDATSDIEVKEWESTAKGTSGFKAVLHWTVTDAALEAELDRTNIKVKQEIFLDFASPGVLSTAKGKNMGLGRIREALGLNTGAFNFMMLAGRTAKIHIKHTISKGEIYANVDRVAALS